MAIAPGEFVEIEFIGKTTDNDIFDTNIKEEAKKIGRKLQENKTIICIGEGMLLKSIDEFLIGKDLGKYTLSLTPEKAFGLRKKELVKIMPSSVFKNSQYRPQAGMLFTFDNMIGKVNAVSGGRVVVDFNNPLAGKNVVYELDIKSKVTNQDEKVKSLMNYFFKREFPFEVKEEKIIIQAEKPYIEFIKIFEEPFKKLLNLGLEVSEAKSTGKAEDNKEKE